MKLLNHDLTQLSHMTAFFFSVHMIDSNYVHVFLR